MAKYREVKEEAKEFFYKILEKTVGDALNWGIKKIRISMGACPSCQGFHTMKYDVENTEPVTIDNDAGVPITIPGRRVTRKYCERPGCGWEIKYTYNDEQFKNKNFEIGD